jgi:Thermolysin metallopeptidase, catalytic domain
MTTSVQARTRKFTILAQDPSVRIKNKLLRATIDVPAEEIGLGPRGYRVHVVDYDSSTSTLYRPLDYSKRNLDSEGDPFAKKSDGELLNSPAFHAQNVYAIVMKTLARFEYALGRRVSWGFYGHQIKVAPHAFAEANAFYSERDQALMFGYFPGQNGRMVYACLSHDVVAHETTHALLDGLRERYTDPSSPEQAAFHEGFADIVALLSVFALPDVVKGIIDLRSPNRKDNLIARTDLSVKNLRSSLLMGLAKEMGQELSTVRGKALRQSAELEPSRKYIKQEEYLEPHRRGEILVAAMMNAFLTVWSNRLQSLGEVRKGYLDRGRVVEEGAAIADYLLTMAIRSIDYAPPVDLEFCDFLSAVLTSDREINPNDNKYRFREILHDAFVSYGIDPASKGTAADPGIWDPPEAELPPNKSLDYECTHFESMQRDPDEVFRFIWQNRQALKLNEDAYSRVLSVRPCLRIGPDGFALRETVAEYIQMVDFQASELRNLKVKVPKGMPKDQVVRLYGGGALIFDEYGKLKFHVRNRLNDDERQTQRLEYLWKFGFFRSGGEAFRSFSALHRRRMVSLPSEAPEEW